MTSIAVDRRARSRRRLRLTGLALSAALVVGACSSGSDDDAADDTTTSEAEATSTTLPPCEPAEEAAEPVEPVGSEATGTLITEAAVAPGPHSVLTGVVTATTSEPATVTVVATSDDPPIEPPTTEEGTDHTVALLGLHAETEHAVAVTATTAGGDTETVELSFTSGSLPEYLPHLDVTVSEPDAMAPGITLFNVRWWGDATTATCTTEAPDPIGLIVGLDAAGEVVWYYRSRLQVTDVTATPDGTLLVSVRDLLIREIDLLGNELRELGTRAVMEYNPADLAGNRFATDATEAIDIDSAHHELYELDSGNLLTISTEVVDLDAEAVEGMCDGATDPDGEPIPDPAAVVADIVVELTPDGEVVQEWPMTDYYDPLERPGSDMCLLPNPLAPPNFFYPDQADLRDWTHANAAVLDERTNTLLVSMRHLDAVIGIRYADDDAGPAGELLWELSPDGTLEVLDGEPAYHGHAVEPHDDGTILYFDNGNGRPGTTQAGGDEPTYSRAVRYRIDPEAGTATQVWEHRDLTPEGEPVFAGFLGDADELSNGNVLITYGGMTNDISAYHSRIVEVVPGADGAEDRVVFDLTLGDRETLGFTAYRAERLDLYAPSA
ncbi:MAG: aryl-sulfate sulfotransferase [Acidimicrobiales bacterium]|nr:aryl-sulfate sulfotransferase [Acidimicrobiales bacterium]MCB0970496.1 aryl-sulfate sulfotransferase [Acidimicrobiales bacterium]